MPFELVADQYLALIVWPDDVSAAARLQDRRKTWLTAQAGDVIWLRGDLLTIKAVQLYRVHPVDQCDRSVMSVARCGWAGE